MVLLHMKMTSFIIVLITEQEAKQWHHCQHMLLTLFLVQRTGQRSTDLLRKEVSLPFLLSTFKKVIWMRGLSLEFPFTLPLSRITNPRVSHLAKEVTSSCSLPLRLSSLDDVWELDSSAGVSPSLVLLRKKKLWRKREMREWLRAASMLTYLLWGLGLLTLERC